MYFWRKEKNALFNYALNTWLYMVIYGYITLDIWYRTTQNHDDHEDHESSIW